MNMLFKSNEIDYRKMCAYLIGGGYVDAPIAKN